MKNLLMSWEGVPLFNFLDDLPPYLETFPVLVVCLAELKAGLWITLDKDDKGASVKIFLTSELLGGTSSVCVCVSSSSS